MNTVDESQQREFVQPTSLKREAGLKLLPLLRLVPYSIGTRILELVGTQSWLRHVLFRRQLRLLDQFMDITNGGETFSRSAAESVCSNFMAAWRMAALIDSDQSVFDKWVRVQGLEFVSRYVNSGRGVVLLNSHYGLPRFGPVALSRRGYSVVSLDAADVFATIGLKPQENLQVLTVANRSSHPPLEQVYQARLALMEGKILHLAGDGAFGTSRIDMTVHGRERPFATGFADLALMTDAAVVPVFTSVRVDGSIDVEFLDALDAGNDKLSKEQKAHLLVAKYVELLASRLESHPGNIRWIYLRRFHSGTFRGIVDSNI